MCANDLGVLGAFGEELVHLGHGTVEDGNRKAVVVHVQCQVLAHDGHANDGNVCFAHFVFLSFGDLFFQGSTSGKSFSNSVMSEASYAPAKVPEVNLASPSL
jgi:hypothetical protein